MKYISGLILMLILLAGCQTKVTENTNIETASLDGYVVLENASTDTINVMVEAVLNDDNSYRKTANLESNGYFIIPNLKPGNYTVTISFDVMNYDSKEVSATLFMDKKTSIGEINFTRIEPTASISGYVGFEAKSVSPVNIDFYYKVDNNYEIADSTVSDSSGHYNLSNLFPKEGKLVYLAQNYDAITKYISLTANQAVLMDTVVFENIPLIQNKNIDINGVIDDGWNSIYENTHTSSWSASNDFDNLYIAYDDDSLYIAVDGGFDSGGNCVNIYIDTNFGDSLGVNDFSTINGGGVGDHLRKDVTVIDDFKADIAFSEWSLSSDIEVVALENPVNNHILTSNISVNSSVMEIAIPISEIYPSAADAAGKKIAVVALIGGGDDVHFADDTIPQQDNASHFETVLRAKFPN